MLDRPVGVAGASGVDGDAGGGGVRAAVVEAGVEVARVAEAIVGLGLSRPLSANALGDPKPKTCMKEGYVCSRWRLDKIVRY